MSATEDFAIVIGISRYPKLKDLEGPVKDAERFWDWLIKVAKVVLATWYIRSEKRTYEQRSTLEKGGVHVKRNSAFFLGEEYCGAVRELNWLFATCVLTQRAQGIT